MLWKGCSPYVTTNPESLNGPSLNGLTFDLSSMVLYLKPKNGHKNLLSDTWTWQFWSQKPEMRTYACFHWLFIGNGLWTRSECGIRVQKIQLLKWSELTEHETDDICIVLCFCESKYRSWILEKNKLCIIPQTKSVRSSVIYLEYKWRRAGLQTVMSSSWLKTKVCFAKQAEDSSIEEARLYQWRLLLV